MNSTLTNDQLAIDGNAYGIVQVVRITKFRNLAISLDSTVTKASFPFTAN